MRAIGRNLIIEKDPKEEVTAGGIIIPSKKEGSTGVVISVGEKVEFLKVGDRIKYHPLQLTDIGFAGKDCGIIKEGSCIAIV